MTNIELQQAHASIRMCGAVVNKCENIDWEQRRYEIAKEVFPITLTDKSIATYSGAAEKAVNIADYLIEELKKRK